MMKMKLRRVRVLKSPNGHSDKVVSVSDIIFCLSDKVVRLSDKDEGLRSENLHQFSNVANEESGDSK